MATYPWAELLALWSIAVISSEKYEELLPPNAKLSGWIGYTGATEAQIQHAETHLATNLPLSYREFLMTTNGWSVTSPFVWRLWSVDDIDWYHMRNQDTIDMVIETYDRYPSDEEYFVYGAQQSENIRSKYLQRALELTAGTEGYTDAVDYVLNPHIVTATGEWEAWKIKWWKPLDIVRYQSFWDLMQSEYQSFLDLA